MRILDFSDGFESASAPTAVSFPATSVSVTPTGNLGSSNAQAALVELQTDIDNHLADTTDAHDASAISSVPSGNLAADDVQEAVNELQGDIDAINTSKGSANGIATLDSGGKIPSSQIPLIALVSVDVVADITARDALTVEEGDVAVVTDAGGGITKTYIYNGASWTEIITNGTIAAHMADAADAHAASAITNTPSGNLAATNVQTALNELQTDVDGRTLKSTLTAKGDLYVASASATPVAVPVGTDDHVLTADSSQASGVKWAPAGAGGTTLEVTASKTTTYTAAPWEYVMCDASGGAFTVTFPTAVGNQDAMIAVHKDDTSSNEVTIEGDGAELVGGLTNLKLVLKNGVFLFISDNAKWNIVSSHNSAGSSVRVDTSNGYGSTNTKIQIYTNSTTVGSAITYATSAANANSFTINSAGTYGMIGLFQKTSSNTVGISNNSNQLTTNIETITAAHRLAVVTTPSANFYTTVSVPAIRLAVNDVVRVHNDAGAPTTAAKEMFYIYKISD